jgi:hypothetical protein
MRLLVVRPVSIMKLFFIFFAFLTISLICSFFVEFFLCFLYPYWIALFAYTRIPL